jgi:hypothetical protein
LLEFNKFVPVSFQSFVLNSNPLFKQSTLLTHSKFSTSAVCKIVSFSHSVNFSKITLFILLDQIISLFLLKNVNIKDNCEMLVTLESPVYFIGVFSLMAPIKLSGIEYFCEHEELAIAVIEHNIVPKEKKVNILIFMLKLYIKY